MKRTITFTILFITNFILSAQKANYKQNIRGVIIDKDTETPLAGASVVLLNHSPLTGCTSDADGKFILKNIPVGRVSLKISFIGYNTIILNNLMLTSGKELVITVKLKERVILTDEITVKPKIRKDQPVNKMATVSARSFTVEETERYAGSLGDPSRMVANFAGVSSVNDSRNDIIIRGNTPTGLLWRLDGIEIPNPNHFGSLGTTGGPISMLNNNVLTNSDFFTSAWPAQYGNAISGVFDLKMRSGNNENHEFTGQAGFGGFEIGAEGPIKKGGASYLINYRYSTLSVFNFLGFNIGVGDAVPQYQDLTFKLNIPTSKAGTFSLFGLGGMSFIKLYDSEKKPDTDVAYSIGGYDTYFGSDMGVMGLSHLYFFNKNINLKTAVSFYGTRITTLVDSLVFDENHQVIPELKGGYYRGYMKEKHIATSAVLKYKINRKNLIEAGIKFNVIYPNYIDSAHFNNSFETLTDIKGRYLLLKTFIEHKLRFNDKITLNTGIYSQYFALNHSKSLEPRVGIKYDLSHNQSINFGYGLHSQTQVGVVYFYQTLLPDGTYIKTNEELEFTYSNQFVTGYNKLITDNTRVKIETYYQALSNIPVKKSFPEYSLINSGDDFYYDVQDSLINKGTGKNYGIELTLERFLSKGLYYLFTASIFNSKYKGYDGIERNTAWNGNYIFNALAGYEFKAGKHGLLSTNFKTTLAGGKRYVPINLEESAKQNKTVYDWDNAYKNRYSDYFRIDLRFSYKLNGKKINQEWAVDLQNVTNHKNIFRQVYNKQTGGLSNNYQTGFFPVIMYRINF